MKTLRLTGTILLSILIVFCISSCGGDDDEPVAPPSSADKIEFSAIVNTNPVFDTEGGTALITFTASKAWTATATNNDWLSISPASGNAGIATLTLKTTANETFEDRTATITIKSGIASGNINVTQRQKDVLNISCDNIEVDVDGGEITVEVKANIDFSVKTGVDWISESTTRSMSTQTFVFTVAPNKGYEDRTAEILFVKQGGGLTEKVTVTQKQCDAIILSQNEYDISVEGGVLNMEVSANVDYSVKVSADWVTQVQTRAMQNKELSFNVGANKSTESRSATITVSDGHISQTALVRQRGVILVTGVTLNYANILLLKGDSFQLEATIIPSNADYKTLNWISSDSSVVKVDENGKLTALRKGTAVIKVVTTNGAFSADCQVTVKEYSSSDSIENIGNENQDW